MRPGVRPQYIRMYLRTSSSFQIVWDKNGGSTSRRAGATTPLAKKPPSVSAVVGETEHSGPFPPVGKEELHQSTFPGMS